MFSYYTSLFFVGIFIYLTELFVAYALIKASRKLHSGLLHNILRSPMSFFDTTPIGRKVNRFSKDVEIIDNQIIYRMKDSVISVFCVLGNIVIVCKGTTQFIVAMIPVTLMYFYVQVIFHCKPIYFFI